MLTPIQQRELSANYIRAALQISGLDAQLMERRGKLPAWMINDYLRGAYCPSISRMFEIQALTGVSPDDYGLPVNEGMKRLEDMRKLWRDGHTISEIAYITGIPAKTVNRTLDRNDPTLKTVLRLVEAWREKNIGEYIKTPEFAEEFRRARTDNIILDYRAEREKSYIRNSWGAIMADEAVRTSEGRWEWHTGTLYKITLEMISGTLYRLRVHSMRDGGLRLEREVTI